MHLLTVFARSYPGQERLILDSECCLSLARVGANRDREADFSNPESERRRNLGAEQELIGGTELTVNQTVLTSVQFN